MNINSLIDTKAIALSLFVQMSVTSVTNLIFLTNLLEHSTHRLGAHIIRWFGHGLRSSQKNVINLTKVHLV